MVVATEERKGIRHDFFLENSVTLDLAIKVPHIEILLCKLGSTTE